MKLYRSGDWLHFGSEDVNCSMKEAPELIKTLVDLYVAWEQKNKEVIAYNNRLCATNKDVAE